MTFECTYRFEELRLHCGLYAKGYVDVEFESDGDWQIANVLATRIESLTGDNRTPTQRVTDIALRTALIEQRSNQIQCHVLDEIHWSSEDDDRGDFDYHQRRGE
jgi:hypothetical protein